MTVGALLAAGAGTLAIAAGGAAAGRLEADLLLGAALARPREWLWAHPGEPVPEGGRRRFLAWARRRSRSRIPVALLLGRKEFMGLELEVRRGVFVPRPETEGLVERVERWMAGRGARALVAEPCTGTGAIAVSLAARTGARVLASDVSAAAVRLARRNARRHGVLGRVSIRRGSLLATSGPVDAVVANPPYVPLTARRALPPDVARHDPARALFAGRDGLAVVRRLVPQAAAALRAGGLLALEIGHGQGALARALLRGRAWRDARVERDLAGRERYVLGVRTATPCGFPGAAPTRGGRRPPLRTRGAVGRVRT